jgi:hypothetical protein
MGMADPENKQEMKSFLSIYILQMIYFLFRQHCETTGQTHGGEASHQVDSRI